MSVYLETFWVPLRCSTNIFLSFESRVRTTSKFGLLADPFLILILLGIASRTGTITETTTTPIMMPTTIGETAFAESQCEPDDRRTVMLADCLIGSTRSKVGIQ